MEQAKTIIANNPGYVQHIYGEKEVGGTEWIYISDVPFEKLGFKTGLTEKPLPSYTSPLMTYTPIFGGGGGRRVASPCSPIARTKSQARKNPKAAPPPARRSNPMKGDRHECAS